MKQAYRVLLSCAVAAVLALTGCGRSNSGSGSSSMSMSGSSSSGSDSTQTGAWRTGLGIVTETSGEERVGKIDTVAAAVLLDEDGKLERVQLDELELTVSGEGSGEVDLPTDYRTKRQKGEDYPLAAVSSLKKGWAEQADAFGEYLTGKTMDEVKQLKTDDDGKPVDADLLSGCTIAVDTYRDAVVRACENAKALGAAKGDRVALGVEAANSTSSGNATNDKDVNAQIDTTIVALTTDRDGHVTSAIGDMIQPTLTISADGSVAAPEKVQSKLELGDSYGMRKASSLDKEWFEHSEGYCSYLKGKTAEEIAAIPADGSDADLAALCTISITDLQKATLVALDAE